MKKTILALLALTALAAACHERRQDPDYNGVRARAAAAGDETMRQTPPADGAH